MAAGRGSAFLLLYDFPQGIGLIIFSTFLFDYRLSVSRHSASLVCAQRVDYLVGSILPVSVKGNQNDDGTDFN